jgi:hypothetical protein
VASWLAEDPETIVTAIHILQEQNEARAQANRR